jgi:hypothetical protein
MQIIGCDLHARQQTLAMLDTETGEVVNCTLLHEGGEVREFYSQLPSPALVGIEAIGPMQRLLSLLKELGIECQVGDAAKIRAAEPRKQKHDRRWRADSKAAGGEALPGDLEAQQGAARFAGSVVAPPSLGTPAHADRKCTTVIGDMPA